MELVKKLAFLVMVCVLAISVNCKECQADAAVARIKDIAKVQGMRSNQLIGYGLVVGLEGTGDSKDDTKQAIRNMLMSFGINIPANSLKLDNSAAVMVTATLPPFVREGDTIDVTSSSIGDADSLQGGTLLQTPLRAADGEVYAVAQGPVSTGGFVVKSGSSKTSRNFPTVGLTPNGAIVEKTVEGDIGQDGTISFSLSQADFTTASRVASSINSQYGNIASAANPGRVDVTIPHYYRNNVVEFIATIEDLPVVPDNRARIVINERTGTIVMGGEVSVDECAITQGGISVSVKRDTQVNQPNPLSYGTTIVTSNKNVSAKDDIANTVVVPATANISDIVGALNTVGATARDTISILQALKAAGAIHADLEVI